MTYEKRIVRNRRVMALKKLGHTMTHIAATLCLTYRIVQSIVAANGAAKKTGPKTGSRDKKRTAAMRQMRTKGATLQAIADRFGITRERVRQIVSGSYRRAA